MAPTKQGKRAASPRKGDAKKAKQQDSLVVAVVEALAKSDVSDSCRQFLTTGCTSLSTPKDERHDLQQKMVEMIGEEMASIERRLQQAVDDEQAKLSSHESSKEVLNTRLSEAEAHLATRSATVQEKSGVLMESAKTVAVAKATLAEKQAAQRAAPEDQGAASAVQAAEQRLETLSQAHQEAAKTLAQAKEMERGASAQVDEAKVAVTTYGPLYAKAAKARDACLGELTNFRDDNKTCFEKLRDRVAEKPAEAPEDQA